MTVAGTSSDQINHIFDGCYNFLLEALNVYALFNVFTYVQVNRLRVKQIHNLLVVNFQIAGLHQELDFTALLLLLLFLPVYHLENVFEGALHETTHFELGSGAILARNDRLIASYLYGRALNCESFARSGLTVRKNGSVVSEETTVCNGLRNSRKNLLLRHADVCYVVKREYFLVSAPIKNDFFAIFYSKNTFVLSLA